jgi:phage terminase small subunit
MLTERQQRFVEAYLGPSKGNAADAARRAGYNGKDAHGFASTGQKLLSSADIQKAVSEAQKATRSSAIADIVEIHEFLTEVVREASVEPRDRIKAAVELAKMRGQYEPERHDVNVTGGIQIYLPDNGRDP